MKKLFLKAKKILKNQQGEMSFFTMLIQSAFIFILMLMVPRFIMLYSPIKCLRVENFSWEKYILTFVLTYTALFIVALIFSYIITKIDEHKYRKSVISSTAKLKDLVQKVSPDDVIKEMKPHDGEKDPKKITLFKEFYNEMKSFSKKEDTANYIIAECDIKHVMMIDKSSRKDISWAIECPDIWLNTYISKTLLEKKTSASIIYSCLTFMKSDKNFLYILSC